MPCWRQSLRRSTTTGHCAERPNSGVSGCTGSARSASTSELPSVHHGGRLESIRCPALLTHAEDDRLARSAEQVYEALTCPKALLRFTAAEGAGEHCEMGNRPLLDQRVFDWLDETLGLHIGTGAGFRGRHEASWASLTHGCRGRRRTRHRAPAPRWPPRTARRPYAITKSGRLRRQDR